MSTAKELKKEIERGVWDASLGKLYGRRAGVLERQRARYADVFQVVIKQPIQYYGNISISET